MGVTAAERRAAQGPARVVVLMAAAVVAIVALAGGSPSGAAGPGATAVGPGGAGGGERIVVVGERDTLWDLAFVHAPAGTERGTWVAQVAERNDVDPRALRPGDVLRVPSG